MILLRELIQLRSFGHLLAKQGNYKGKGAWEEEG
jgi:hypothetical protein